MTGSYLRGLRTAAVFLVLASLASLAGAAPALSRSSTGRRAAAKKRPNILLIVTDDQRDTPLTDMRATRRYFDKGGTDFTNAFVTTPLCCPSRSSIMTGRYVHNHGVSSNGVGARLDVTTTVQSYLDRAGYRTALMGKYLNAWGTTKPPKFWDRFAYFLPDGNKYYDATLNVDGKVRQIGGHSNQFLARRSVSVLEDFEKNDDAPWYMYVSPKAPHAPFRPAPGDRTAHVSGFEGNPAVGEEDRRDKPPWIQDCIDLCGGAATGRRQAVRQQRSLLSVDALVHDVFRQLDRLGEDRRTLAIFVSDNGYMWGEHGKIGKTQPYEPSVRVPLYVRWPGHVAAGGEDARLVANIDIAPTILEAASIGARHPIDGHSLFSDESRDFLLLESLAMSEDKPWGSIRTPTEQYTEYYYDAGQQHLAFQEYYDLAQDPWELDNLLYYRQDAAEARAAELAELLATTKTCAGDTCP